MGRYEVVTSGRNHYVVDSVSREFSGTAFTSKRAAQTRADEKNGEEVVEAPRVKVAGVAGGVGTTVTAVLLEGDDLGLDAEHADVVVARNDYRCARALVALCPRPDQVVLLLVEEGRALTARDFADCVGHPVVEVPCEASIARSDDADLLESVRGRDAARQLVWAVRSELEREKV